MNEVARTGLWSWTIGDEEVFVALGVSRSVEGAIRGGQNGSLDSEDKKMPFGTPVVHPQRWRTAFGLVLVVGLVAL